MGNNILSKEFEQYRVEYCNKLNYERECYDEMAQAYDKCNKFVDEVAKPNKWVLSDEQKMEEQHLYSDYEAAIDKWDKAHDDVINFPKTCKS